MRRLFVIATIQVLVGVTGCKRESTPEVRQVLPPPAMPTTAQDPNSGLPAGHPPIDNMNMPGGALPQGNGPVQGTQPVAWTLPKGWSEQRAGGMRLATFKPSLDGKIDGKIDVSVIVLPGTAGGELSNVNRWRGQIGLGPIDEATREHDRHEVKSKAGAISLYDFTGEGTGTKQRMLAALLFVGGQTWFIKMIGDEAPVAASRADFVKLLESLHPASGS
jgi:hypothetical protein